MAGGDQSSEDRTETATARHLDQARDEGQVPVSREAASFATLALVVFVLYFQSHAMVQRVLPDMVAFLSRSGEAYMLGSSQLRPASLRVLGAIAPVLVAAMVAGAAAVLLQTNFLLHLGSLQPRFSRVSPAAGLKRVFGFNGMVEVLKSLLKLGLLAAIMWFVSRGDWPQFVSLPWQDPHRLLPAIVRPVSHVLIAGLWTQAIVAGGDLLWVRFRHARDLRMSKQDIRDEMKETEGNPHIKARIRRIRVMRARQRMMAKVPKVTVVVTNPTHYAVALAYERVNNPAPRIVAKGADSLAARIRELALANGVPVIANPPLARALHRLDLDTEIPAEHFKAVAEIIAYVWRLKRPGRAIS